MKHATLCLILSLPVAVSFSQDSSYWRTENKTKSRFWGNSIYLSAAINFSKNREYDLDIGRTNGIITSTGRGLGDYSISSWSIGYSITDVSGANKGSVKLFYEYSYFPFIMIGNFSLRGEYLYNTTDKQHYLRPSAGLTFIYLDISYNYSFLLGNSNHENIYRHGLSIRPKFFISKKNWERRRFVRQ